MIDRNTESPSHLPDLLSLDGVQRVLCVALRLEDAVLGCGGLMAACADMGASVHVVMPVDIGQEQGRVSFQHASHQTYACSHREALAAEHLGIPGSSLLGFPRHVVRYDDAMVQTLSDAIRQHRPQVLLLPSLSQQAVSHRALTLAGLSAACSAGVEPLEVLQYEHWVPLHANVCFPIDEVADKKWTALRCLDSIQDSAGFEAHARALAALRAFGLRPHCRQGESFFKVHLQAVRERGGLAALPQWPWVQKSGRQTVDPLRLPLVSVLVRSMNRDCLPDALASVALQIYTHLEVVVVNASGGAHRPLDFLPASLPWRIVQSAPESGAGVVGSAGPAVPCGRAQAANLALAAAQGEYALFLDDDDLLQPQHLERLIAALQAHPQAVGAYAGVRVETHDGAHLRDYDLPWSRQRLQGVNYLPIHAVLFRLDRVRQRGLRFNEQLPVLEDWDFWLRLTEGADLVHCPGVSAVYRQGLGQSALGDAQHPHHWRVWHRRLLLQRVQSLAPEALAELLAWHAVELDRTQAGADRQDAELRTTQAELQHTQATLLDASSLAQQHQAARDVLQQQLLAFGRESQAALDAKEAALQHFGQQARQALDAKEAELQRVAADAQRALHERDAQLAAVQAELRAIHASRSWRWTAVLRRDGGPAPGDSGA